MDRYPGKQVPRNSRLARTRGGRGGLDWDDGPSLGSG